MPQERINTTVTLYECRGCELLDVAGNAETAGHMTDDIGDQLECRRCGALLRAGCFRDYIDKAAVDDR